MLVDHSVNINDQTVLKLLSLKNTNELYNTIKYNQQELAPWFNWAKNISLENTQRFINFSSIRNQKNKGCDLGIFFNGQLAGIISFTILNFKTKEVEIAYWLSKDFCKKGIMTNTCKKIEEICFAELNLLKTYIIAFAENRSSRAIPEKLGYKIVNADKEATIINNNKSYYIYYTKTQEDYKSNFWNNLIYLFNQSQIVIDYKKGEQNKELNSICPLDFGHLNNDWNDNEKLPIWIGSMNSRENETINSIVCTMNIVNKFTDINILYKCTEEEKCLIFNTLQEKEGVLLINK